MEFRRVLFRSAELAPKRSGIASRLLGGRLLGWGLLRRRLLGRCLLRGWLLGAIGRLGAGLAQAERVGHEAGDLFQGGGEVVGVPLLHQKQHAIGTSTSRERGLKYVEI